MCHRRIGRRRRTSYCASAVAPVRTVEMCRFFRASDTTGHCPLAQSRHVNDNMILSLHLLSSLLTPLPLHHSHLYRPISCLLICCVTNYFYDTTMPDRKILHIGTLCIMFMCPPG